MQDKDVKQEEKENPRKLVGENTYGLGVMAKYSWMFVLSVTAALSLVAMTVFQPGKQGWRSREDFIVKLRKPADFLKDRANEFSGKHDHKLEGVIPVVGASFLLASILKRALEIPAFWKGRREARKANEKYATVVDENTDLLKKLEDQEGSAKSPEQKPFGADKMDERPSGQFATDNKPTVNHAASIQERKSSSAFSGTSV